MDRDHRDFHCRNFYPIRAERSFFPHNRHLPDASVQCFTFTNFSCKKHG